MNIAILIYIHYLNSYSKDITLPNRGVPMHVT